MSYATSVCESLPHRTHSGSSIADILGSVAPLAYARGLEEPRVESFLHENSADVRAEADAKLEPVQSPDITKEGCASASPGTAGFRGIGGCPSELRRSAILPIALSAEEIGGAWVRA